VPVSLNGIESKAFSSSSLEPITIPRIVQFIDGLALSGTTLNYLSIEAGYERFTGYRDFLIDLADHRLIQSLSSSSNIAVSSNLEILESFCFSSGR
jgi:hypothetical protein